MYNYGGSGTWANAQAVPGAYAYSSYAQQPGAHGSAGFNSSPYAASVPKPPAAPYQPAPVNQSTVASGSSWTGNKQATPPAPRTGSYTPSKPAGGSLSGSLASSFVAPGGGSAAKKPMGATQSVSGEKSGGTSYTGYDAAVYAAATNYLQSKSRGGNMDHWTKSSAQNKPYSSSSTASAGLSGYSSKTQQKKSSFSKFGGYGSQQEKLQAMQEHYCEVCKISCLGPSTYQAHMAGIKHKKKEEALKRGGNNTTIPPNRSTYKCDVCDVTCASMDTFNAHVKGKNHLKTVRLLCQLGKPVGDASTATVVPPKIGPEKDGEPKKVVSVSKINFVSGKEWQKQSVNGGKSTIEKEPEMVGNDYVEGRVNEHNHTVYFCKLCQCDIIDAVARDMHLKGRRHRLAYKKKVDPDLEVEYKAPYNASSKYTYKNRKQEDALRKELMRLRHQEMASMRMSYESEMTSLMGNRQQMMGRSPFPLMEHIPFSQNGNQFRLELNEDKNVKQKHQEIYPTETELIAVQRVVNHAEQALKGVSDAVEEEIKAKLPENADPEQAHERLLKGVFCFVFVPTFLL